MYNFNPYNVFLAISTNIPQRLQTGFVHQGHVFELKVFTEGIWDFYFYQKILFLGVKCSINQSE